MSLCRGVTSDISCSDIRPDKYTWFICLSFDGLVLVRENLATCGSMLWNPSIRKCRRLPPGGANTVDLGLGFDPLIKDYKLVRVSHKNKERPIAVYTVGTNKWKTVRFQGRGCCNRSWSAYAESWLAITWRPYRSSSVYFKGGLYLISDSKELVSFDLSSEMFTFANLPVYDDDDRHRSPFKKGSLVLVDGGCSLAVIRGVPIGGSIWVLDSSNSDATSLCWTKRCTFETCIDDFLYLKRSGDLVFGRDGYDLVSYNIETQEEKLLPQGVVCAGTKHAGITKEVCGYKESLVLLKEV